MVKWLTDENVPRQIILLLRDRGHDAADVRERGLAGATDSDVFDLAQHELRILVTTDRDFSSVIQYPPGRHAGIVVLRMNRPSGEGFVRLFASFLVSIDLVSLPGTLTIVSDHKVRQRKG
ncbi:MAG: DUF5615 family PIN-like protein [Chloroflexota bacterium]